MYLAPTRELRIGIVNIESFYPHGIPICKTTCESNAGHFLLSKNRQASGRADRDALKIK
jgi:hypothetical protein